jgi:hypothetical protein
MATDQLAGAGLMGIILALGAIAFVIGLIFYIYFALALYTIAKKTKTDLPWLAWIPFANIYLLVKCGGLQWWWLFGFLLNLIPAIGWLLAMAWVAYVWWKVSEARNYPGWMGILMLIPVVNLILVGVIAWRDN